MTSKRILRALGNEILERREPLGLSQEALARRAGLHRNVIGRLERGQYNPTILTLGAIARELKSTVGKLVSSAEKSMN